MKVACQSKASEPTRVRRGALEGVIPHRLSEHLLTTARTSASLFQDDKIQRVSLVLNVALVGRPKGERSTLSA